MPGERGSQPGSYPGNTGQTRTQNYGSLPGSYPRDGGRGSGQNQGNANQTLLGKRGYDSMANQYHKYDGKQSTMIGGRQGGGGFGDRGGFGDQGKIPVDLVDFVKLVDFLCFWSILFLTIMSIF